MEMHTPGVRKPLIVGNWKMNGTYAANENLLTNILAQLGDRSAECAVCVPDVYLLQCRQLLGGTRLRYGAQDLSPHPQGAFTGETAAHMLIDVGCSYVIVGHSERRAYHNESNSLIAAKVQAALRAELIPIVCLGESLAEREAGATFAVIDEQLQAVCDLIAPSQMSKLVLAYEPTWAIGTGITATPAVAQQVHAWLRRRVQEIFPGAGHAVRILYGGSVNSRNVGELLAQPDIDGGLIGAASLDLVDFAAILRADRLLSLQPG